MFKDIAIQEALRTLSDTKVDSFVKDNWGEATTYPYDAKAVIEIAQAIKDVIVTKDKSYFHIPAKLREIEIKKVDAVLKKYNLKEVK